MDMSFQESAPLPRSCNTSHMTSPDRKKILFVITKSNWGGAQRYVYDLAMLLPSEHYDAVVALGGEGILYDLLKEKGFKVHVLKSLKRDISFFDELRAFFELIAIIRKEHPDILHVNSSKAGALGALAGRICRVRRIIFTAHGWAFNEDRPLWQKTILKTIHWLTVLLAHHTIAVSHGLRAEMTLPFAQKKMSVVHPGRTVHDAKYRSDARGILEMKVTNTHARLIDYHDDFWIGTIAELHPIKRLNRAINAVSALTKEFPALRYIIIGDGQLRAELQEQVSDLGLQEHVFFTGTVAEAARYASAFDLFILPSHSEAFGYVLIEAGQARVPVVATSIGGITDIIENDVTGLLVPPDNTPALTQAIRTLIDDETLRSNLSEAHYARSATFTAERMTEETIAVYER